jgi:2-polyprenyl-6-methoxyphenol hydroxylase-like FAD-dependent oxidoreductase
MPEKLEGAIVCGAGPVGLVTALKLARLGVPVTVLDAGNEIVQEPRAVVYHAPVVRELDRLGLLEDLQKVGVLKQHYHFWTMDHRLLCHLDFKVLRPEDTNYPFNLHLGQPQLAAVILEHLMHAPGAQVRWGCKVTAIAQDADAVTVTCETAEGEVQLQAPWFVGADGARSGVRKAMGLAFEGVTWPEWFVATNVFFDFEANGFGQSNIINDPDHWAIIPKIDQTGLWRCTYREDPGMPEDEIRARLPERYALFHRALADVAPEQVSPYRVHNRCIESFRIGRVLMAGDAAHVVNPIGGLGLTSGLLDAVPLAEALASVFHGRRDDGLLDLWAEERRRILLEIVSPTSTENLRRIGESDPDRRAQDYARFARLNEDPALQREALMVSYKIASRETYT